MKYNHSRKAIVCVKATSLLFSRLYCGVDSLTNGIGNAVVEVGKDVLRAEIVKGS